MTQKRRRLFRNNPNSSPVIALSVFAIIAIAAVIAATIFIFGQWPAMLILLLIFASFGAVFGKMLKRRPC